MLFQADEALMTNDDVIDQLDIEDAAGLHELSGRLDIVRGGRRVAAGVVVAEDEAGAVADNGWAEHLGGAQDRAVGGALVEARLLDPLAPCVPWEEAPFPGFPVSPFQPPQGGP